jgi:[ribosomal protein S18]-alanine N-acetyltransferase
MKTNFSKYWLRKFDARPESAPIAERTHIKEDSREEPRAEYDARGSFASADRLEFRPMTTADLDEVMLIERSSFRFPWSPGFFRQELQVACARSVLAEIDGKIVGYVLFWLLPGAIDIHNIAVHADYRRRGIARMLLGRVIDEARHRSALKVMLEVRKSNVPAQKLYESMGFLTIGIRKGYYSDDGEDALAMTLNLNPQI